MFDLIIATSLFVVQQTTTTAERLWRTPEQIQTQLSIIANANDEITNTVIGYSNNGSPIHCLEIARPGSIPIEDRSAILVVAGIDSSQILGVEVAVDLAEALLTSEVDTVSLLEDHKIFIIPVANPDVMGQFFETVKHERTTNNKPYDNDNDGRKDEDSPEDLNGDGNITMMRVFDAEHATHHADADEPRLSTTPDDFSMKTAEFTLYVEGVDNDNDGEFNEDSIGGVNINNNFMHGYTFHGAKSGSWQLSENASKALVDFALAHQEIALVLTYGLHDTLTKPMKESGNDPAGAPKTIHNDDTALYEEVSTLFNEYTSLQNTTQPNWDGSFVAWVYAQYGVPSFSTPLWCRPGNEDVKKETAESEASEDIQDVGEDNLTPSDVGDISQETLDELFQAATSAGYIDGDEQDQEITPEQVEMYCKMMGIEVRKIKSVSGKNQTSSGDTAWLEYSDTQRNGEGFVEWEAFEHPQLGKVEIGGWVPYFKTVPPTDVIEDRVIEQIAFLTDIARKLPDVHFGIPIVKELSHQIWEIKIPVKNDGWFPSGTTMAEKNKRARPYVVRIDVPTQTLITGKKVHRIWSIKGGGTTQWHTWVAKANLGDSINITLYSEKYGTETISVSMSNTNGGEH